MRRPSDTFSVDVEGDAIGHRVLTAGRDFRADFLAVSDSLGLALRPRELDLVRLAAAVYAVDRLARRPRLTTTSYPNRFLRLTFYVSDVGFWRSHADMVAEPLRFLSEDLFELTFLPSRQREPWLIAPSLFADASNEVALLSGGLDSAAGLVAHLAENPDRRLLTVTVEHQPHQRRRVRDQIVALPPSLRERVVPTFTRATLIDGGRIDAQERTQRLRGFLFTSLGGAVASCLGLTVVNIYENGVGAVNVPPLEGMTAGGLATRGAHPHFLRSMSRLVSAVAGVPIRFELPFQWHTKGEMIRRALDAGGAAAMSRSVSCVHYPLRKPGPAKQCGTCAACIGHRVAAHAAAFDATADTFARDPRVLPLDAEDATHAQLLRGQIYQLRNLASSRPEPFQEHLLRTAALTQRDTLGRWTDLHVRHLAEANAWLEAGAPAARRATESSGERADTDTDTATPSARPGVGVRRAC